MTAKKVAYDDGILKFEGTNDGKNFAHLHSMEFDFPYYTIEVWFETKKTGVAQAILSAITDDDKHGILLIVNNPGQARYFHMNPRTGKYFNLLSENFVNDGKEHHLAAVMSNTEIAMYLDGVKVASNPFNAEPFEINLNIFLGQHLPDTAVHPFYGKIGKVRIWNEAKTPTEIKNSYEEGMSKVADHKITIYQHQFFGGKSEEFTTATPNLETMDNQMSSCKVEGTWELYPDPKYGGTPETITPGEYKDHAALREKNILYDHISSFKPKPD